MRWTDNPGNEAQFVISRCAASSFSGDVVTYAVAADTTSYSDTATQPRLTNLLLPGLCSRCDWRAFRPVERGERGIDNWQVSR